MSFDLTSGALSECGRRAANEDRHLVIVGRDAAPLAAVAVVADGMGGHSAGDVAATMAVDGFARAVGELREAPGIELDEAAVQAFLHTTVRRVNEEIMQASRAAAEVEGMGTTVVVAAVLHSGVLVVAHVGDSRAYLVRDGELVQLTSDHSALVEKLHELGQTEDDLPEGFASAYGHWLTRSLGHDAGSRPDLAAPLQLVAGDRLLLVSDGVTDVLDAEVLQALAAGSSEPEPWCRRIVEQAYEAGSKDNITAVALGMADAECAPATLPLSQSPVAASARGRGRAPSRFRAGGDRPLGTRQDSSFVRRVWLAAVAALLLPLVGLTVLMALPSPGVATATGPGLTVLATGPAGSVLMVQGPPGAEHEEVEVEVRDGAGRVITGFVVPADHPLDVSELRDAVVADDRALDLVLRRGGAVGVVDLMTLPVRQRATETVAQLPLHSLDSVVEPTVAAEPAAGATPPPEPPRRRPPRQRRAPVSPAKTSHGRVVGFAPAGDPAAWLEPEWPPSTTAATGLVWDASWTGLPDGEAGERDGAVSGLCVERVPGGLVGVVVGLEGTTFEPGVHRLWLGLRVAETVVWAWQPTPAQPHPEGVLARVDVPAHARALLRPGEPLDVSVAVVGVDGELVSSRSWTVVEEGV